MKRVTDFRVSFRLAEGGMSGWYFQNSERAARSFAGIRRKRIIQRVQSGGGWLTVFEGADPKPEKVRA